MLEYCSAFYLWNPCILSDSEAATNIVILLRIVVCNVTESTL